jgi:hypothetical protein
VWAGGRLYNVSRDGEVVVLAAAKRFELLARNPLGEGSHATPAIAGGRIFFRTFTHLIAVGAAEKPRGGAPARPPGGAARPLQSSSSLRLPSFFPGSERR